MPKTVPVPAYKLHKASGQARVIIAGKHHYLGKFDSPESKERYARLIAEASAGACPTVVATRPVAALTVLELVDRFWVHAQTYYQKHGQPTKTLDNLVYALRPLKQLYGSTPVDEFAPLKLKALRQHLINSKLSRGVINSRIFSVKNVFSWGVSEEIVPASISHALREVKSLKRGRSAAGERPEVPPVPDDVVEETLEHLPQVVADMVRFQRLTRARPGEVCIVRPCDVDRCGAVWVFTPESHKTEHHGKQRRICIGPKAQAILRPYLLCDANAYCFSPKESEANRHGQQRENRKTRVQPSQQNRSRAKRARPPADQYDTRTYNRAICRGATRRSGSFPN